jgi:hypothetical protein
MTLAKIIARARKTGRVKDGLVLCDNCDTPASKTYSTMLSWTGCGPCATGQSSEFDASDLIPVEVRI